MGLPTRNNTYMMPGAGTIQLKYLFTAHFKDGSSYEQNEDDISCIDNKRSCFYDVLQRENEIIQFSLTNGQRVFLVDIRDGHFEVNNVSFRMHDGALPLTNMRLIFYRQREVTMTGDRFDAMVRRPDKDVVYCIGWQANDERGNNIKRIMEID